MSTKLYYVHDPMCSWCWGYRPTWARLQLSLSLNLTVEYVSGGLAPDSDVAMPIAQQEMIKNHWRAIENKLGTQFNFDFWRNNTPRRSTYNACRASIAAAQQGFQSEMIGLIQQGYYLRALNPSDVEVLMMFAQELSSIADTRYTVDFSLSQFQSDFHSAEIEQELQRQIQLASTLTSSGFPSLVLEHHGKYHQVAIDYENFQSSLDMILEALS